MGNDSDEDEEILLPTSEDLDKYLQSIELVKRLIEARGVINCHCGEAVYDFLELRSHMVEKHIIKKPIQDPKDISEDEKIHYKSFQEEAFFKIPKEAAKEAAEKGHTCEIILCVKGKKVPQENDEDEALAQESDEVISAKYLLPLLRSWRREYVCR